MFFELFDIGDSLDVDFDLESILSGEGERLGVASFLCCSGESSGVESPSVSSLCRTGVNSSSFSLTRTNDELFDIGDNFDLESLLIGKALGLVIGFLIGLVIGLVIGLDIGLEIEINDGFEGESIVIGEGLDLLEGEYEVSGEIGDNLDLDLEFLLSGEGERLGVESLLW